ncbi:MAG: tetratricopeptide repeat protein [Smithella sp.]
MVSQLLQQQTTNSKKLLLWSVLLAILTALPYLQMHSHQFINWDDPFYIYHNPMVSQGLSWQGLGWAFTTGMTANWHPLTWISHMLDASLFGPTPAAAHLVNLVWYAGCVILIFFLFFRLGASLEAAFFMTAFWGLHPLHVESVAWASERKDLLCAFFFLAATLAYLQYARKNNFSLYLWTTGFFILALLAKPMAVTWPCVAILLDGWPLERLKKDSKKIFYEKIPWLMLTVFSSIITLVVQHKSAAVKSLTDFPLTDRLANAALSYVVYMRQSIWPLELTVFYPYPYQLNISYMVAACLILAAMTVLAIRLRKNYPYLVWGWLFYLGVLFPVIGIVQVGGQAHADRYMLLPQTGIILATGLFLDRKITGEKIRKVAGVTMIILIAALMGLTFRQVAHWENNFTLFNHNLETVGENELAHFNLGSAYLENNELELAITHFSAAAGMNPHDATTFNNMGIAYARQEKALQAETCFRRALDLNPGIAQPHFHLAVMKIRQGLFSEALEHLDTAVQLAPDWAEVRQLRDELIKQQKRK